MNTNLPSIDAPIEEAYCDTCGAELTIVDPPYCAVCEDRRDTERRIQSGNDYRRKAQIALDLEMARRRANVYVQAKLERRERERRAKWAGYPIKLDKR